MEILLTSIILAGVLVLINSFMEDGYTALLSLSGTFLILLGIFLGVIVLTESKPKPIDVYNNKTTLQITYQDSIPIDTVVVWKNEWKNY